MASLLNNWITLYDENIICDVKNEPKELQNIMMLLITFKNEFKKVENLLNNKLDTLKNTTNKENQIDNTYYSPKKDNLKNTNIVNSDLSTSPILKKNKKLRMIKANIASRKSPKKKLEKVFKGSDEDVFDSSTIISATPVSKSYKKTGSKIYLTKKKQETKLPKNSTLTQLFDEMSTIRKDVIDDASMDIDEILNEVNAETVVEEICKETKIFNSTSVSSSNKIPQLTPEKNYPYIETVRGNAKQKLRGWSCKNCEEFYKGMKLTSKELEEKMNACSKHRSKFKPLDETNPDFWKLTIPSTPEYQKTQSEITETQESISNNSTIWFG